MLIPNLSSNVLEMKNPNPKPEPLSSFCELDLEETYGSPNLFKIEFEKPSPLS